MRDRINRGAALGALCAALVAARADAQPSPASTKAHPAHPAGAHAAKGERKRAKAERAEDKADRALDKADKAEAKARAKGERAEAEQANADKDETAEAGADPARARGQHRGRGHRVSAVRALHEEFKSGKLDKAEFDKRLAALKESAEKRRQEHRQELGERWGAALGEAATREELRHHARRMAFLERALVVAQTEKTGKERDALIERIEKLVEKENARHDKAMDRFEPKPSPALTKPAAAELPSEEAGGGR